MIFTVVASGDSAKNWIPRGTCIGSNDCEKWGKPVDFLVLANAPRKFKPERLNIIKKSKAKILVTSVNQWKPYFPQCERIQRVTTFNRMIMKGFVQTSVTSPIMCLSIAISKGADEVIMWGIDMLTHHAYKKGTKSGDREIALYRRYFREMQRIGVKLWRGADGSVFDDQIPLYENNN